MSRIGKRPVEIPPKVEIKLEGTKISVKGPNGQLERTLNDKIVVKVEDKHVDVERANESNESRSLHGLTRTLIENMVKGVTTGYTRVLEINGVGYRAELRGNYIRFDLGYSHPIFFELPEGVKAEVKQTEVTLKSANKEVLGQAAAKIRSLRKPEPYKGKGVKYKEEVIRRKAGKSGGR
jgi:large subunit ribosomal protein L6